MSLQGLVARPKYLPLSGGQLSHDPCLRSSQTCFFRTWLFAMFTRKRSFALFCTLLRSLALFCRLTFALVCAHLRSFSCTCVFLPLTACRTTAFGNCRLSRCVVCSIANYRCYTPTSFRKMAYRNPKTHLFGDLGSG